MSKQSQIAQKIFIVLQSIEAGNYAIADNPDDIDINTLRDDLNEITEDME